MKKLLLLLLLAAPVQADNLDSIPCLKGTFGMYNAHIEGDLKNHLAAEAPPIKYQVESIHKEVPSYNFGSTAPAASGGINYDALANAVKALESKPVEDTGSPFYSYPMPGVE